MHNAGVADAIVLPGEGESPGAEIASQAAHDAATAEGGARVREEIAAEHAEEAQVAAAVALEVAKENAETAQAVIETGERAELAASTAEEHSKLILEALNAQSSAIAALSEQFAQARESQAPAVPEKTSAPERTPGGKKPTWVRR